MAAPAVDRLAARNATLVMSWARPVET